MTLVLFLVLLSEGLQTFLWQNIIPISLFYGRCSNGSFSDDYGLMIYNFKSSNCFIKLGFGGIDVDSSDIYFVVRPSGAFFGPSLGNTFSILVKLDPSESLIYGTTIGTGNGD